MYDVEPNPASVIGLTGSFGSGCTYVAENILASLGYKRFSLSEALRQQYLEQNGNGDETIPRSSLQAFGDATRRDCGAAHFATRVGKEIVDDHAKATQQKYVVDSIRNPEEIHLLRKFFPNFFLIGVYASRERRWGRVKGVYDGDRKQFDDDDECDTGRKSDKDGQRVEDCFAETDVVLANDLDFTAQGNAPFRDYSSEVKSYVDLISDPLSRRQPTQSESLMATAYTISQRSSCLQRKVGAVIIDDESNIISSGFNEVPRAERPCSDEYGKCRRK